MTSEQNQLLLDLVNRNFKDEADARAFVKEIDIIISAQAKDRAEHVASKEDLASTKASWKEETNDLKAELIAKINENKTEIQTTKIDLIKWMFGFWVTLVMLILGAFFLKK